MTLKTARGRPEPAPRLPLFVRCETSRRCFDLYLARLSGLLLGKGDGKHAVLVRGADVFRVERVGHRKAAREVAVVAFDAVIAVTGILLLELALARNGEGLIFDAYIDILEIDIRQIGLEDQLVPG